MVLTRWKDGKTLKIKVSGSIQQKIEPDKDQDEVRVKVIFSKKGWNNEDLP